MTTKEKPRSDITMTRLLATTLAAITAAFLGSRLGTAGTVIGAGVASLVSTVAGALYQHSLDRTSNRLRSRVTEAPSRDRPPVRPPSWWRWRTALAVTMAAFVLGMGAITGYELLTHRPIAGGADGTTVGSLFGRPTQRPTTTPTHPPTTTRTTTPTTVPPTTTAPPTTTSTVPPTTTTTPVPTTGTTTVTVTP